MNKYKFKLWDYFLLIGIVEIIIHFTIRLFKNDFTSLKILHLIFWTLFTIICLIKVINNNKK